MTSLLKDKQAVYVTDSRLIAKETPRPILRGAKEILYKSWAPTGASNSLIQFSCPTPLQGAEIDRNIRILCPARITCSAVWDSDQNGQYLAQPNKIGIRSYPLLKAAERIDVGLNTKQFNLNIGSIVSAIEHFSTSRALKLLEYSTTSTYGTCQSQRFSDMNLGIRSGLSTFEDSISGIAPQNFPFTVYQNTAAAVGNDYTATCIIDLVTVEDIWVSPLHWGSAQDNYDAFVGISTFDLGLKLQNDNPGFRMIAIDNTDNTGTDRAGTITGDLQVTFTSADNFSYSGETQPKLLMQYIKPQDPRPIDKPIIYPYYQTDQFVHRHDASINAGSTDVISPRDILLHKLPSKIFIYARKPNSTFSADPFTPDAFTSIENIKLFWNNRTVLSEAHKSALYELSVKNALQYEYAAWSGYPLNKNQNVLGNFGTSTAQFAGTGAILCLDPLDLGLDDALTYDPNQSITFGADVTVKNIAPDAFTPELYIVVLYDGVMELSDGVVRTELGIAETKLNKGDYPRVAVAKRIGSHIAEYKFDIPSLIRKDLKR